MNSTYGQDPLPTAAQQRERVARKLKAGRMPFLIFLTVAFVWYCVLAVTSPASSHAVAEADNTLKNDDFSVYHHVYSRQNEDEEDCVPSSASGFPDDLISQEAKDKGAIIIHIVVAFLMFIALAIVVDDYFVASLEHITEQLNLSNDVAGATFMAAGGSAPEFFTALFSVIVSESDTGVGTIVGSATFNVLFVIGACAFFARGALDLTWWPLFRDCIVYVIGLLVLAALIHDGDVEWWEALILFTMYLGYVVIMKFDETCHNKVVGLLAKIRGQNAEEAQAAEKQSRQYMSPLGFRHVAYQALFRETKDARVRWRCMHHMLVSAIHSQEYPRPSVVSSEGGGQRFSGVEDEIREVDCGLAPPVDLATQNQHAHWSLHELDNAEAGQKPTEKGVHAEHEENEEPHAGCLSRFLFVVSWPWRMVFRYTIPNCAEEKYAKYFWFTFFISILWIAILTYILVWMVSIIGETLGIPDSVMGLTFLAAGTSIPDLLSSVAVAKQGFGDMAVSSSIGSNIFDILVGLPIPWLIQTGMVDPGSTVTIYSDGLFYSILLLLVMVAMTVFFIRFFGWKLDRRLGVCTMGLYAIFLTFSILLEYNVFGDVNPPTCED
eukprot:Clim_evm3s156 gene=Clim_evmTU3s156